MAEAAIIARVLGSPQEVDAAAWNALLARQNQPTPFMRHEYLAALEASGSATVKKRSHGPARKVAAASSARSGTASKACCKGCTTNGSEYSIDATTSPPKVNGSRPRPSACMAWPTAPCGPSNSSR